jgi:hypothetical protein
VISLALTSLPSATLRPCELDVVDEGLQPVRGAREVSRSPCDSLVSARDVVGMSSGRALEDACGRSAAAGRALAWTLAAMSDNSAAVVIDLAEYRRRRQPAKEESPLPRPQVMWVPTAWGYWVPVWAAR